MKKIIILGLCIFLWLMCLSISVKADDNIINRIFKGEKIDNEICDDGENVFLNKDCKLDFEEFKTGEIFMHMWFIRLLMIVALIMFIRKDTYLPLVVIFILILLIAQGSFGDLGASKVNQTEEIIDDLVESKTPNPLVKDFKDFGGLVLPNSPYLGGILLLIGIYFFGIYLPNR